MIKGRTKITRFLVMLVTAAMLWSNVQPMGVQAAGNDAGIISVAEENGKIAAVLYGYSGSVTTDVSFYRDGERVEIQTGKALQKGQRLSVTSESSMVLEDDELHYYTVIISDDDNRSNNNRTWMKGQRSEDESGPGSGSGSEPDVEVPQQTANLSVQSVSWTPENPAEGDEVAFTISLSNTGDAAASNVSVKVTVDNTELTGTVNGISAGGTATLNLTGTWTPASAASYGYSVEVTADSDVSATDAGVITVSAKPEATLKSVTLTCTEKSSDSMTLEWGLNDDGTESPDLYVINVTANGSTATYTSKSVGNHTFSNLTPETEYTCTVTAKKDSVEKSTATIKVTTDKAAVEEETAVKQATASDSGVTFSTVTLSWGYDSSSEGEVPTEYIIKIGDQTYTRTSAGTEVFTGLASGVTYAYTVTAVNGSATTTTSGSVTTKSTAELTSGIDIVVSDIIWEPESPAEGDAITFSAVITNQGTQSSNNAKHGTRFYVDDETNGQNCSGSNFFWCDTYTSSLASGASTVITVNGNSSMGGNTWTGTVGSHKVTVFVDDSNLTGDGNRNNNYLTKSFTVKQGASLEIPEGSDGGATVYTAANAYSNVDAASNISVTVNNKNSAVFLTEINNARYWDWRWKEKTPTTIFELKEEEGKSATVRVKLTSDVSEVVVRPLSAGITPEILTDNGEKYIQFDVTKCGSYTVEFNGKTTNALQMFVNPPYSEWHNNGVSGYTGDTYIGLGEVRTSVPGLGGHVYGSGVVINNHGGSQATNAYSGAKIEGITLLNTYDVSWEVEIRGQSGITFDYFHIVASGSNSDGISIQGSSRITIQNSYIRTWDDCVVLKNQYVSSNTNNITVDNCVFWSDLAQAMEIGAETNKYGIMDGGAQIYDATFKNTTVIHAFHKPSMSVHNMDNAQIYNVTWENITIEDAQMGNNGGNGVNGDGWPLLIDVTNVIGGEVPGTASSWSTNGTGRGSINNVTFKNIKVLSWQNDTGKAPGVRMLNSEHGGSITNVKIQGLTYGNTTVSNLDTLQNIAHCQFTHLDSVPGAWPSATTSTGHDSSYAYCTGNHFAENFDTSNLTISASVN